VNPDELVHENRGRWIVAERDGIRYTAPLRANIARISGCGSVYGPLDYVAGTAYSYARRSDALRKAREIYGGIE